MFTFSDWKQLDQDKKIPYNLESLPLQLKTESSVGGGGESYIVFRTKTEEYVCDIAIEFRDPLSYYLFYKSSCSSLKWRAFEDVTALQDTTNIWKIEKADSTTLTIYLNGVVVLHLDLKVPDSDYSGCAAKWSRDIASMELPSKYNNAEDDLYYMPPIECKPMSCLFFDALKPNLELGVMNVILLL